LQNIPVLREEVKNVACVVYLRRSGETGAICKEEIVGIGLKMRVLCRLLSQPKRDRILFSAWLNHFKKILNLVFLIIKTLKRM